MKNFQVKNSEDTATIDIFGDIGESWWGESYTMQDAKNDLKAIKAKEITVNISSLGGSFNDAVVIHDLLKDKDAEITTNMYGLVASAGTIVGMAGKNKRISANGRFLIHNVWGVAVGNAEELRKTADAFDSFDGLAVQLYHKALSEESEKTPEDILNLMGEEKWIEPEDAKSWGFVDEVYEPGEDNEPINKVTIEEINSCSLLPNLTTKNCKALNIVEPNIIDTMKAEFKTMKNIVVDYLKGNEPNKEIKAELNKMQEKITEAEKKITNDTEKKESDLLRELHEANEKFENLMKDYTEIIKRNGGETTMKTVADPTPEGNKPKKTKNQEAAEKNAAVIRKARMGTNDRPEEI